MHIYGMLHNLFCFLSKTNLFVGCSVEQFISLHEKIYVKKFESATLKAVFYVKYTWSVIKITLLTIKRCVLVRIRWFSYMPLPPLRGGKRRVLFFIKSAVMPCLTSKIHKEVLENKYLSSIFAEALERRDTRYGTNYFAIRGASRKKIEKKRIPRVPTSKKV
jgi:hypothetical protein